MEGLSSKAAGKTENKKNKFQDQEFNDDLGVNYYEFKYRNHDPQIGRFIQIDPLADEYVYNSTYAFSENKVTGHIELEGLEAVDVRSLIEKGIRQTSPNASEKDIARVMKSSDEGQVKGGLMVASWLKIAGIGALMFSQPEIGIPLALSELSGVPVTPSPQAMAGSLTSNGTKTLSTLDRNKANGAAFEKQVVENLAKEGHTDIAQQVTIKADNGVNTRLDAISIDKTGVLTLTEAKSSSTATLTKNQTTAFPSIAQSGGIVVGKGKQGYPGGTLLPPTQVNIVRPVNDATFLKRPVYLPQLATSNKN